jgi:hypothetical protein
MQGLVLAPVVLELRLRNVVTTHNPFSAGTRLANGARSSIGSSSLRRYFFPRFRPNTRIGHQGRRQRISHSLCQNRSLLREDDHTQAKGLGRVFLELLHSSSIHRSRRRAALNKTSGSRIVLAKRALPS